MTTEPDQADDTHPAVTRVLHALAAELHESLCNCRAYPASCTAKSRYDQDDMVATLTYAPAALEEALKQGWTPPAETSADAVKDVADAIEREFLRDTRPPFDPEWTEEARAAIAAYRPHLTAERDGLRAQVAELTARKQSVVDDLKARVGTQQATLQRHCVLRDQLQAEIRALVDLNAEVLAHPKCGHINGKLVCTKLRGHDLNHQDRGVLWSNHTRGQADPAEQDAEITRLRERDAAWKAYAADLAERLDRANWYAPPLPDVLAETPAPSAPEEGHRP